MTQCLEKNGFEYQSLIEVNARQLQWGLSEAPRMYQSLIEVNSRKIEISGYPEIVLYQSLIEVNARTTSLF